MSHDVPGPCPVCGGITLAPATQRSTLLAVCDVLVLKALEKMGNYIVRAERSRFNRLGTRPKHEAHTLWPATDEMVDKALRDAWDVVPVLLDVHGCCDVTSLQVTNMLDSYVHDLVLTGNSHRLAELQYRFESRLGLPVFDHTPHQHGWLTPNEQVYDLHRGRPTYNEAIIGTLTDHPTERSTLVEWGPEDEVRFSAGGPL